MVSNWIMGKQQIQQAVIQTKLAVEANRARLAMDIESHNSAWEMAELAASDKVLRRASFIMFTAPFLIAIFAPHAIATYFSVAITPIPDWYKETYMLITGAVWGVSSLKNPVSMIANAVFSQAKDQIDDANSADDDDNSDSAVVDPSITIETK